LDEEARRRPPTDELAIEIAAKRSPGHNHPHHPGPQF
jgi:hypothetical protein